jgi:hypothetical protein
VLVGGVVVGDQVQRLVLGRPRDRSGAGTSHSSVVCGAADIGRRPNRRARSTPQTAWSCRCACSRASSSARPSSSAPARAAFDRAPAPGSSRRSTAPARASGGDMYRPTMSSSFSTNCGSRETLKLRTR